MLASLLKRLTLVSLLAGMLGSVLLLPTSAIADNTAEARRLYKRGTEWAQKGLCTKAIRDFERSYLLHPHPYTLFNTARCLVSLRRFSEANTYFLKVESSSNNPVLRRLAQKERAAIQDKLGPKKAPRGKLPAHRIKTIVAPASSPKKRTSTPHLAPVSQSHPTSAQAPQRDPSLLVPKPSRQSWYEDKLGWILASSGVALLTAGAILAGVGASRHNDASSETTEQDFLDARDGGSALHTGGIIMVGAGSAAVIAGLVRFWLKRSEHAEKSETSQLTMFLLPHGWGIACGRHF